VVIGLSPKVVDGVSSRAVVRFFTLDLAEERR